ncbi:hypothetical protein FA13DRAFT_1732408 [Coprinellus micaceus]|uniref:Uncharacterized protein n=1 Tax=Coprinellus micaceus TaxID=71717 RepID=A0A4Y7TDF2_COPMI|nr:hypothetical protein FA13DRAFT_1732408 [Coprinellus micaceus]
MRSFSLVMLSSPASHAVFTLHRFHVFLALLSSSRCLALLCTYHDTYYLDVKRSGSQSGDYGPPSTFSDTIVPLFGYPLTEHSPT